MEIILLLIGAGVAYFLYITLQDYLKNPLHQQSFQTPTPIQNPPQISFVDDEQDRLQKKIRDSEYGILSAILGIFAKSDGKACELEEVLAKDLIAEMVKDAKNQKITESALLEIYQDSQASELDELCNKFLLTTKGEYKKRLKVIEFLFVLAYADGEFSESEESVLIDIAALFELSNEDFNKLYDDFKSLHTTPKEMDKAKALQILSLAPTYTQEELKENYLKLLKEKNSNVLDNKQMGKSILDSTAKDVREIQEAYNFLVQQTNNHAS
ncbi:MAG: TerB family tellurite resistance protein [Helicobacter sp.]|uniref:TerB family tellurite resistance protein n=1 Tax=Helicobacter sp. 10-6591 TaxID=2004998 RepID=UPI000DCD1CD2|nr:TerB family tellurite resistance protein [Helicobacter sp. 10-6591]MCI6217933.1 TerB family tellurite resistance protein [Helicobacter sp.]MDD7567164.1 TerB family tellurite resistance protein [Helicobacter sp.]MDY5740028.1 TerB family tellurite resistance protein [Helicobacter sp.]RAX54132.1 hypothetical protein CCY97_06455 [Helicobacter sp. 10-6591]